MLIVLPFVSLSLVISWLSFESQKRAAVSLQAEVIKRAVSEIVLTSHEYQSKFTFIATGTDLLNISRERQRNFISLLQSIKYEPHVGILQEVTLLDNDGMELARSSRTETITAADLRSRAETEEFLHPRKTGSLYYGPVYFDELSRDPMLALAVPVLDLRTGEMKGVIVGQLRLQQVWGSIVSRMVGNSGVLYITDGSGKVIAHPNPSVVLRMTQVPLDREPGIHVGMLDKLAIVSSDLFSLGEQSFYIVTETPLAESLALSKKTLYVALFVLLFFLVLAISFGVFTVSQVATPIESLAQTAAAVSEGNYGKAAEAGYREISTLGKSFNKMTSQLLGKIDELKKTREQLLASKDVMQQMVLERTEELQRTNRDLEEEIVNRVKTEEFLRRYSQIVNSSLDYISFVGRDNRVLAVNNSYLTALGRERSEVVSRHVREIWEAKIFREEIKDKFERAFAGYKIQYEVWLEIGHLGKRFYEVAMTPFQEGNRDVGGVVVNIRDATARWNLERDLRQAGKMKAVGTLAAGIAHDFNNALHNIFGCARVAQQNLAKDSKAYYWLNRLQQVGDRAAHLIGQIQSFSRNPEPIKIPLNFQEIIQDVLRLQKLSMPANIEVRLNLGRCGRVLADATQIHQVLANLFSNGVHAMSPQGGELTVEVKEVECENDFSRGEFSGLKAGKYAQITISDNGDGIEKELVDRIFEPFFTTKSFGNGTGLGLAITHGIVHAHNGRIIVRSVPGEGTSFQFYLPVTNSVEDKVQEKEVFSSGSFSGQILFIDDEEEHNEVWKIALEEEGFKVTTVTGGLEALELFGESPDQFDLIITDQKMPDMKGTELAEELRDRGAKVPIIMVTGWANEFNSSELREKSIMAVLSKPVRMEDLLKDIDLLLSKKIAD